MLFSIKIQSVFALAVAITSVSAIGNNGGGGGGGIRGATSSSNNQDGGIPQVQRRRHLQMEDKNGGGGGGGGGGGAAPVPAFVPTPTLPPAPVAPPTLSGINEWKSRCSNELRSLNNCVPSQLEESCTNCLYAIFFNSNPAVSGCRNTCNGDTCINLATSFFECGAMIMNPVAAPVVVPAMIMDPVAAPVTAPVVPAVPDFTSINCPANAISGDACTVPSGFLFQECFYAGNIRCTCRSNGAGRFLCNVDNSASVPVPAPQATPTTGSVPSPTTDVIPSPVLPDTPDTSTCASSLPKSGDTCDTGGQEFITCCYAVDFINNIPAPANLAEICGCRSNENVYLCNAGTTASCSSIIRPGSPVQAPSVTTPTMAPILSGVTTPTMAPILSGVTTPTMAPILSGITTPTMAPILSGVTTPPVFMGGTGCPARLSDFENGSSCAGLVPDDKASIGCGYEVIVGSPPTSSERILCQCDKANPLWECRSLGIEPIAAPNQCPPQDSPPLNGDSCAGLLVMADSSQECMFSRRFSSSSTLETFNCTCSNAAGSTVDLWSCDGSFMPVTAPSLMPAGQVQPSTSMMPVPATPTATMTCANIPFPGDGTSCVGVLPAGLSSATCNYSQTITTDGVPVSESATCECDSSNVWNCQGSFTPAPPNAVPVVPTDMMPILSGVPEPTEMPILSGVPAPTEMPILSGVPAPTDMPILSGVPAPTATLPPAAPSDGSIAIPDSVNFSSGSAICPAKITNCEPCAQFFEGAIEGSCSQFTQVSYLGVPTTFRIQCRCPLQSITNPTWSCVFIGGDEGSITVPASPICAPEDFNDPEMP